MKNLYLFLLFVIPFLLTEQTCKAQLETTKDTIKAHTLKGVTVKGHHDTREGSLYQYGEKQFSGLVSLIGEPDVLRYIATLPGVAQGMECGMSYYIRGGSNGNNRYELDDVPIYGSTHLFGVFSVFHPDIISNVNFYDGGIPASTGNLLSSVTQLYTDKSIKGKSGTFFVSPFMTGGSLIGLLSKDGKWTYQTASALRC